MVRRRYELTNRSFFIFDLLFELTPIVSQVLVLSPFPPIYHSLAFAATIPIRDPHHRHDRLFRASTVYSLLFSHRGPH